MTKRNIIAVDEINPMIVIMLAGSGAYKMVVN
jgi:hypothetical protein